MPLDAIGFCVIPPSGICIFATKTQVDKNPKSAYGRQVIYFTAKDAERLYCRKNAQKV
jgi:hypothetical protein